MARAHKNPIFDAINPKLLKYANASDREKRENALTTKSRNIWSDIILRFFKNKWNVLFALIFLFIIFAVYILKYATGFSPTEAISGSSQESIHSLQPSWIDGWNKNTIVISNTDFLEHLVPWYNPNITVPPGSSIGEASDQAYLISKTVLSNGDLSVKYINPFAVKTILGTDAIGRDVLTRLLYSAQWSLNLAFFVATVEAVIGISVGIYLGYHVGKSADTIMMRFIDMFSSVPALLWMFVFTLIIGTSFWSMALVLIFVGWVGPVYSARIFTLKVKDSEFILAAKAAGSSEIRILFSHILPNVIGRLLVSFVHRIPAVIFFETTLVFLGFNVGGENANSIGNLINSARDIDMIISNVMFIVSISTFLLVLSISLQIIANGIRDAFDPKVVQ